MDVMQSSFEIFGGWHPSVLEGVPRILIEGQTLIRSPSEEIYNVSSSTICSHNQLRVISSVLIITLSNISDLMYKQELWPSVIRAKVAKTLQSDCKRLAEKPEKPIWKLLGMDNLFWNSPESICSELNLLAQTPTHFPTFLC